ncbi:hypothetical protein MUK42_37700 [Musa troglodytarum]|uniref:Uncharacterized protein n=1 Tax=Musa troglodytarum TaxID=320322 RepID=A0A9E7EYB1_9LILI|nr:hypothetical protein MUK42_37700 [Musa troglodytarum]
MTVTLIALACKGGSSRATSLAKVRGRGGGAEGRGGCIDYLPTWVRKYGEGTKVLHQMCEAAFDLFHLLGSDLEGPGEDVVGHRRGSCEERNGDGLGARKLAVEGGDDGGRSGTVVLLEVNEPPGKYEHLALGNGLGYQLVGSGDEADVEGAVEDEDDLGGTRVGVGRVQPAGGVVNPG